MEDKSFKTQYQVSYVPVEAMEDMEVYPAAVEGNLQTLFTMSPARPDPGLDPDHALSQLSLPGSKAGSPSGVISCP